MLKNFATKIPTMINLSTFNQNNLKEECDSGIICINSRRIWDETKEPFVLPKHYNKCLFLPRCVIYVLVVRTHTLLGLLILP